MNEELQNRGTQENNKNNMENTKSPTYIIDCQASMSNNQWSIIKNQHLFDERLINQLLNGIII